MSSRVNLNENSAETFGFTIGGLDYDLKYPTLEEIEPITELSKKREVLSKTDTPEAVEEMADIDNKLTEEFYKLIIPVGHETPIADTLRKQPFPVVKAFNKMVLEQLSAE